MSKENSERYSIEYQGREYQGISGGEGYEVGDIVFVTCPNGIDSLEEKIIVGKKSIQEELVEDILDKDNDYINIGSNIKQDNEFDNQLLQQLWSKIDGIKLSAEFTAEPENIDENLNYGIELTFDNGKTFVLDINDMIGYPYYYPTATTQEKIILKEQIGDFEKIKSCVFFTNPEDTTDFKADNISIFAIIERNKITQDEVLVINRSNTNTLENNESSIQLEAFLVSKDEEKTGAYSWEVKSEDSEEWITLSDQESQTITLSPTTVWAKNYQIRGVVTPTDEDAIYSESIDIINDLGLTVNISREENTLIIDSWDSYTGVVAYLWQVKDVHGQLIPDKERKFRTYPIDPTTIEISNEYIGSAFVNGVYIGSDSEFVTQVIPPEPSIPPAKIYSLSLSNDREMVAITSSGKPLAGAGGVIASTVASVWEDNTQITDANITLIAPDSFYNDEDDNKVLNSELIVFNGGKLQLKDLPAESVDSYTFIFEYKISEGNVLQEDFVVKKFASEEDYSFQIATPVVNLTTNPTGIIMFYVTRRDTNGLTKLTWEESKTYVKINGESNQTTQRLDPETGKPVEKSIEHYYAYNKDTVFPLTITLTVNDIVWDEEEIEAVKDGNKGDDAVAYTMELTNEKDILLVEKSTGLARAEELSEAATGIQILENEKNIFDIKNLSISNTTDFIIDSTQNKVKLNKTATDMFTDAQQFSTEINYKVNDSLILIKTFTVTTESDFEHEYFLVLPISINANASTPSISWKVCKDNSNTVALTSDNCTLEIFEGDSTTVFNTVETATSGSYTLANADVSRVRFKLSTGSGDSKYIWDEEEVSIVKNGKTPVKGEDYSDGVSGDSVVDEIITAYWTQKDTETLIPPSVLPSKPNNTATPTELNNWRLELGNLAPGNLHTYKTTSVRKTSVSGEDASVSYSWTDWSSAELYAVGSSTDAGLIAQVNTFMGITKGGEKQGIYYVDVNGDKITDLSKFNPSTDKIYINAEYIKTGTLDASIVTVTNLDASKITSGYLSADRIEGKSINAEKINTTDLEVQKLLVKDSEGKTLLDAGVSSSTSVSIGGFTVEKDRLSGSTISGSTFEAGEAEKVAGIRGDDNNQKASLVTSGETSPVRFWSGKSGNDYTFVVLADGSLYATAAQFTGANITIDDDVKLGDQTVENVKQNVSQAQADVKKLQNAGYQTKTDVKNIIDKNENGFLTSATIPDEYITKEELTGKGYATTEEVNQKIQDALGGSTASNNSYSEGDIDFTDDNGETAKGIKHYMDMNYLASYGGGNGSVHEEGVTVTAGNYNTSAYETYSPVMIESEGSSILQVNIYCQIKIGYQCSSPYFDWDIGSLRVFYAPSDFEEIASYVGYADPTTSIYTFKCLLQGPELNGLGIDFTRLGGLPENAFLIVSDLEIFTKQ